MNVVRHRFTERSSRCDSARTAKGEITRHDIDISPLDNPSLDSPFRHITTFQERSDGHSPLGPMNTRRLAASQDEASVRPRPWHWFQWVSASGDRLVDAPRIVHDTWRCAKHRIHSGRHGPFDFAIRRTHTRRLSKRKTDR